MPNMYAQGSTDPRRHLQMHRGSGQNTFALPRTGQGGTAGAGSGGGAGGGAGVPPNVAWPRADGAGTVADGGDGNRTWQSAFGSFNPWGGGYRGGGAGMMLNYDPGALQRKQMVHNISNPQNEAQAAFTNQRIGGHQYSPEMLAQAAQGVPTGYGGLDAWGAMQGGGYGATIGDLLHSPEMQGLNALYDMAGQRVQQSVGDMMQRAGLLQSGYTAEELSGQMQNLQADWASHAGPLMQELIDRQQAQAAYAGMGVPGQADPGIMAGVVGTPQQQPQIPQWGPALQQMAMLNMVPQAQNVNQMKPVGPVPGNYRV